MNKKKQLFTVALLLAATIVNAQDASAGAAGLEAAATEIEAYFPTIITICYAIGGVVGLVGGIRIFNKWNSGDQDINKELISYGGAMLFLVIVPNVVGAFSGL